MKVRCPNCKAILRVPDPKPEPSPGRRFLDLMGISSFCKHPENVKVDGKCLACEKEKR